MTIEHNGFLDSSDSQEVENEATDPLLIQLNTRLEKLVGKKSTLESQTQLVTDRLKYLSYAISRWEKMCLETARALQSQEDPIVDQSSPTTSTTTKPKRGYPRGRGKGRGGDKKSETSALNSATSSNEAPCGFDVRLIWDDKDWAQWTASEQYSALHIGESTSSTEGAAEMPNIKDVGNHSELTIDPGIEEGVICLIMRKKCDRHLGWQKTRENDFQTELNTLNVLLDKLLTDIKRLQEEIEERERMRKFRFAKKNPNNHIVSS